MAILYRCQVVECNMAFYSLKLLISHMRLNHSDTKCLNITCGIAVRGERCNYVSNTVETYRKHVRLVHEIQWKGELIDNSVHNECANVDANSAGEFEYDSNFETTPEMLVDQYNTFLTEFGSFVAGTSLKVRELHNLPKSTSIAVGESIQGMFDLYQTTTTNLLRECLKQLGLNLELDPVLSRLLSDDSIYENATRNISSKHKLRKFISTHLNYIAPVPHHLDETNHLKANAYFVPISKTLKRYLEHEDVWASCQQELARERRSNPEILENYIDGEIWRNNPEKQTLYIRIHFYTDETEMCNPIGSRKVVHKASMVYFYVGNIERKYCSALKNIHLALICKYSLVKTYGYDKIMQPLIADIKYIEQHGITINIDGVGHLVKGTVMTLSGDNLSSHSVGGFSTCFTSGRMCRTCMASRLSISGIHTKIKCN